MQTLENAHASAKTLTRTKPILSVYFNSANLNVRFFLNARMAIVITCRIDMHTYLRGCEIPKENSLTNVFASEICECANLILQEHNNFAPSDHVRVQKITGFSPDIIAHLVD